MCQYCAGTGACVLFGAAVITWLYRKMLGLYFKIIKGRNKNGKRAI